MAKFCYKDNVEITEGKAKLFIPVKTLLDPHHSRVFYNPCMVFNRTLSCLFIFSALKQLGISHADVFDGYSATGIRGIRYSLEAGAGKVVFNETNDDALPYLRKNIKINKLKSAEVDPADVNVALQSRNGKKFDVVELDPFGSPLPALASALQACSSPSILSLTFTDLANLCGGKQAQIAKCLKQYGARPMRCIFSHELALRIALGKVARVAAGNKLAISPLACWYEGHYVKLILKVEKKKSREKTGKNAENNNFDGFTWLCRSCLSRGMGKKSKCWHCGAKVQLCGPLWVGKIGDGQVLRGALENCKNEKVRKFVEKLLLELTAPTMFYNVEEFSSIVKNATPRLVNVIAALQSKGFSAVATHFSPTGFKTSADANEIKKTIAFCCAK